MSDLWTTSSDSTLSATGKPIRSAAPDTSLADRALIDGRTGSPYSSRTFIVSDGDRYARPARPAASRSALTASRSTSSNRSTGVDRPSIRVRKSSARANARHMDSGST